MSPFLKLLLDVVNGNDSIKSAAIELLKEIDPDIW
jgi:hypothetical protein